MWEKAYELNKSLMNALLLRALSELSAELAEYDKVLTHVVENFDGYPDHISPRHEFFGRDAVSKLHNIGEADKRLFGNIADSVFEKIIARCALTT